VFAAFTWNCQNANRNKTQIKQQKMCNQKRKKTRVKNQSPKAAATTNTMGFSQAKCQVKMVWGINCQN